MNVEATLYGDQHGPFAALAGPVAVRRRTRMFASRRGRWPVLLGVPLAALLVLPLIMLGIAAFSTASPLESGGVWTLAGFRDMWTEINVSHALTNSLIYAVSTTVLAVGIAFVLCFLSERTETPLRRLITPIMMVCASTSTLFYAVGYSLLANRFNGILNVVAQSLWGASPIVDVETWPGLVLVDSLHAAAFLFLFMVGPFGSLDRSLEEAALVSGASRLRVFFTVNVQLLRPILSSVVLMGLIVGLKSFNIPLILGAPADISFLTVRILRTLQDYEPPHYGQASGLALSLAAVVALLLYLQHQLIGTRNYVTVGGKSFRSGRWNLGAWRWPATAFIALYALCGVVLPLGSIIFSSFLAFPGVYDSFSLANYAALFANPEIGGILANTVLAAIFAGLAGVLLGFAIVYLTRRLSPGTAALIRGTTQLQLALPGLVGALALLWTVASLPGLRALYGTGWLLGLAFAMGVLPVSVQIAAGALRQISHELEEAARISGASNLRAAFQIVARLLLPSLAFAWLLAMIAIAGDLDVPLLLSSAGTQTVSVQIYKLFGGVDQAQAAALLSLLLGFVLASVALFAVVRSLLPDPNSDELLQGAHP
jgi:iron(III) transport system permease protein